MPSFMSTYLVSTAGFSASLTSSSNFHYHHRALLSFPTRRSSDLDLALQRDRVRREKADAHAGDNGLLDRFGTFQLHRDVDLRKPVAEGVGHRCARVRSALADQEWLAHDHVHRNSPLVREWMTRRGDDHVRMRRER